MTPRSKHGISHPLYADNTELGFKSNRISYRRSSIMRGHERRGPVVLQGAALLPDGESWTVVILGMPRGGTTMVAGVAQRCGLFIGENLLGNLEDRAFVQSDIDSMKATIKARNASMAVWGWKYPRAADYLSELLPVLRNPRLVIVWRDLLATASRSVSRGESVALALRRVASIQRKNVRLAEEAKCPILHVSYEKAIRDPLPFAAALAQFVGGKPPVDADELLAFMEPGSYKPVEGGGRRRTPVKLSSL